MNSQYVFPTEHSQAISHNLCLGCGLCALHCPTQALVMDRQEVSALQVRNSPTFNAQLCVHCGYCAAVCPSGTIFQYSTEKLVHSVREKKLQSVIFLCEGLNAAQHSPYERGEVSLDMPLQDARKVPRLEEGLCLPPHCHLEVVRCTGRLGARLLLRLALQGVRQIVIFACPPDLCQYAHGRAGVAAQVQALTDMLQQYEAATVRIEVFQEGFDSAEAWTAALHKALA